MNLADRFQLTRYDAAYLELRPNAACHQPLDDLRGANPSVCVARRKPTSDTWVIPQQEPTT
jgi:hypothetical protein